jgi:hypothetical protein
MSKVICGVLGVVAAAALVAVAAASGAVPDTQTYAVPFTSEAENTCKDELVTLTGTMHLKVHSTLGSDGRLHFESTVNDASVQGFAAITLARYVENSTQTSTTNFSSDGAPSEATVTIDSNLIRLGEDGTADDLRSHVVMHITYNANGVPTADKNDSRLDCR